MLCNRRGEVSQEERSERKEGGGGGGKSTTLKSQEWKGATLLEILQPLALPCPPVIDTYARVLCPTPTPLLGVAGGVEPSDNNQDILVSKKSAIEYVCTQTHGQTLSPVKTRVLQTLQRVLQKATRLQSIPLHLHV